MSSARFRSCALLALSLRLALLLPLAAQESPRFIDPLGFEFLSLLPDPPSDDSLAGRADLETVLQLQRDRGPEQLQRVERVANQTVFTFAAPILGERFNAESLPITAALFREVTQESYNVAKRAKSHWARPRPHLRDAAVKPAPRASRSASYPSGHASDAATWIVILETLFPERTGAFEDALREVMWCRVLGGSHYPTDTQAGAILGREIGARMLASPAMADSLASVREELIQQGILSQPAIASSN